MRKLKTLFKNKTAALAAVGSAALVSAPAFASGGGGVDVGDVVSAIQAPQARLLPSAVQC